MGVLPDACSEDCSEVNHLILANVPRRAAGQPRLCIAQGVDPTRTTAHPNIPRSRPRHGSARSPGLRIPSETTPAWARSTGPSPWPCRARPKRAPSDGHVVLTLRLRIGEQDLPVIGNFAKLWRPLSRDANHSVPSKSLFMAAMGPATHLTPISRGDQERDPDVL